MADTVINPRGGTAAFFDINFKACLKLQNDSGQTGYTNKIFIYTNYQFVYYDIEYCLNCFSDILVS